MKSFPSCQKFVIYVLLLLAVQVEAQVCPEGYLDEYTELSNISDVDLTESYPWLSNDGQRLYFTKGDLNGNNRIHMVSRTIVIDDFENESYVNLSFQDYPVISAWLDETETQSFFVVRQNDESNNRSSSLYYATRDNMESNFGLPKKVTILGNLEGFISGASLTPDFEQLYLFNENFDEEKNIVELKKTGELEYTVKGNISALEGLHPRPGQLSRDGYRFFTSVGLEPKLHSLNRYNLNDELDCLEPFENLTNLDGRIIMPTVTNCDAIIIAVVSPKGLWQDNDLISFYPRFAASCFVNAQYPDGREVCVGPHFPSFLCLLSPGTPSSNSNPPSTNTTNPQPTNPDLPSTLSIELSIFEGETTDRGNEILWATQTETDNDYFVLERSNDGSSFEQIYSVQGSLNSTIETNYHFLDESPKSELLYYRLKSVDIFGITEYSDIISMRRDPLEPAILIEIIPNPTVDYLELNWNHSAFNYVLYDTTGKPVVKGRAPSQITLDLQELPAGVYFLSLQKGSEKINRQIVKN